MSKSQEKKERKIISLKNRQKFLNMDNFEKHLSEYADDNLLCIALSNQAEWARYERDGFLSMTLNTYKKYANDYLFEGFKGIDDLRTEAHKKLLEFTEINENKFRKNRSDTKQGMLQRSRVKDKQIDILRESNLMLSKTIIVSIQALLNVREKTENNEIIKLIDREITKIKSLIRRGDMLSDEEKSLDHE